MSIKGISLDFVIKSCKNCHQSKFWEYFFVFIFGGILHLVKHAMRSIQFDDEKNLNKKNKTFPLKYFKSEKVRKFMKSTEKCLNNNDIMKESLERCLIR